MDGEFDAAFRAVLLEYHARAAAEHELTRTLSPEEGMRRRDEFLISVGPATATVLNLLIKGARAKRIRELGSSYGYSTLWLAEAARATGGAVISLELSQAKVEHARGALERCKLASYVQFQIGDALESLERLPGPFDFVLIDLWKELYVPCLDRFYPKLAPNALLAADNMLEPAVHRAEAERYRAAVRAKPHLDSVLLNIGSGVELSRLTRGPLVSSR